MSYLLGTKMTKIVRIQMVLPGIPGDVNVAIDFCPDLDIVKPVQLIYVQRNHISNTPRHLTIQHVIQITEIQKLVYVVRLRCQRFVMPARIVSNRKAYARKVICQVQ